jgi:hypothetical protein
MGKLMEWRRNSLVISTTDPTRDLSVIRGDILSHPTRDSPVIRGDILSVSTTDLTHDLSVIRGEKKNSKERGSLGIKPSNAKSVHIFSDIGVLFSIWSLI